MSDYHLFTKRELLKAFKPFLDRLVEGHGCNRKEMIEYHINKLVGLPLGDVLRKMPRGPRGRWEELMFDIRGDLRDIANR